MKIITEGKTREEILLQIIEGYETEIGITRVHLRNGDLEKATESMERACELTEGVHLPAKDKSLERVRQILPALREEFPLFSSQRFAYLAAADVVKYVLDPAPNVIGMRQDRIERAIEGKPWDPDEKIVKVKSPDIREDTGLREECARIAESFGTMAYTQRIAAAIRAGKPHDAANEPD